MAVLTATPSDTSPRSCRRGPDWPAARRPTSWWSRRSRHATPGGRSPTGSHAAPAAAVRTLVWQQRIPISPLDSARSGFLPPWPPVLKRRRKVCGLGPAPSRSGVILLPGRSRPRDPRAAMLTFFAPGAYLTCQETHCEPAGEETYTACRCDRDRFSSLRFRSATTGLTSNPPPSTETLRRMAILLPRPFAALRIWLRPDL